MATILVLTRHGETLENKEKKLQGLTPGTLSEVGLRQAHDLADSLKEEAIDTIVCSDLTRSVDTATIVADSKGLKPIVTKLLRELDWGEATGKTLVQINWHNLPIGAESLDEMWKRASAFVQFIYKNYTGKTVLAVGHGAFNRCIEAYLNVNTVEDMLKMKIRGNAECMHFILEDCLEKLGVSEKKLDFL